VKEENLPAVESAWFTNLALGPQPAHNQAAEREISPALFSMEQGVGLGKAVESVNRTATLGLKRTAKEGMLCA